MSVFGAIKNTLKIKIYEKKPIAILFKKKKKFYLSEKMEIIQFRKIKNYRELPYVFGNEKNFEKFYTDLKKIDFNTMALLGYYIK